MEETKETGAEDEEKKRRYRRGEEERTAERARKGERERGGGVEKERKEREGLRSPLPTRRPPPRR